MRCSARAWTGGMALWVSLGAVGLSGVALAAERPASRVPSPSRDASPTPAPPAAPAETVETQIVRVEANSGSGATTADPARLSAAGAVPAAPVVGPACLSVSAVSKSVENEPSAVILSVATTLVNTCGQPVLSYAGRLEFRSTRGAVSQAIGIYSAGGVPLDGTSTTWRFGVAATVEDIWLSSAPTASMSWTWTAGYVMLADGTVYRGDVVLPDARRGR